MLTDSASVVDPIRVGVVSGVIGSLAGWFARSLLLSSFKQAVISAVRDDNVARDKALDERLAQMQSALDQRFDDMKEDMKERINMMADRRGIPRPHPEE